jgi:hypothetical protein
MALTLRKFEAAQKKYNFLAWAACKHHKTHKNEHLDFKEHKFLIQIYYDNSPEIVIIKSTQCGISEYLIARAICNSIKGMNIFYVLPTYNLVSRFVKNRIEKTIINTKYYNLMIRFKQVQDNRKQSDSMSMRDIGLGTIAFVGSNSTAGFTEFPADEVIIDELDECDPDNIIMAWERMSHSKIRTQIKVANPTIEGIGIDAEYSKSDKKRWHILCDCGKHRNLNFFDHIVEKVGEDDYLIRDKEWTWDSGRDIYAICDKCGRPINRKGEGEWVPHAKSQISGYQISKLYSGTTKISEIVDRFNKGLVNDSIMQRVYNADFGLGYSAEGSKISEKMILDCIGDYNRGGIEDGMILAGIDVGTYYHYVIKKLLHDGRLKTLEVGAIRNTDDLIIRLKEYKVNVGIIDGMPETRESRKIAGHFNYFFLCYYGSGKTDSINARAKTISVDRTSALDAVKEALLTKKVIYPKNIINNREFIEHMTASTRVYNPDKKRGGGTGVYEWQEGSKDDHLFHATAYCLIARRMLIMLSEG